MVKSITHRMLALLYIGAVVVCVLFIIKPGASVFYYKKTIDNLAVQPDAGQAFRYDLKITPLIFRTRGILLYEDGHELYRTGGNIVADSGKNAFSFSETSRGSIHIYFASSDNSDPITNGRRYSLYIPLNFISRPMGIIYLVILLPGLAWFLYFALAVSNNRKILVQSPNGILTVLDSYFEHIRSSIKADTEPIGQQLKTRTVFWRQLFSVMILAAFFYIFMEWLFFATKSSFMSILGFFAKVEIFLLSGLSVSISLMLVLVAYILLDLIAVVFRRSRITRYLGVVIPTILSSALALLMIDNFTYTVFNFGISTSVGVWRGAYGLLFYILSVYIYFQMLKIFGLRGEDKPNEKLLNHLFYFSLGCLVISIGLALIRLDYNDLMPVKIKGETQQATKRPNILLLGSDGVNAEHLSVYGYRRDTTPRLRELAQGSLLAENAFTNSSKTSGSIISIMTSKLPSQNQVLIPPDILTGLNSFQHLPGILKSEGYKTVEYGVPDFVDAYSVNMQNGFDLVNNRSQKQAKLGAIVRKLGFINDAYFLDSLSERISDRIQHIFFISDMQNPYILVTKPADRLSDKEKVDQLLSIFDQSEEPLFVHVHLLSTHGGIFSPAVQVFSKGEQQDQTWMVDFYDDSILTFDWYVGEVIDHLKANGQFENTILIIYSDHDPKWQANERIPLIIHFPDDEFAGRITQNVQNMDIAPTILDYLGLPKPAWMGGESLLNGDLNSQRLIFSMGTYNPNENENNIFQLDFKGNNPLIDHMGLVNIVDCQKWYLFDLNTRTWSSGEVQGYTAPCSEDSLHSFDEIKQALIQRLTMDGFDISSLP